MEFKVIKVEETTLCHTPKVLDKFVPTPFRLCCHKLKESYKYKMLIKYHELFRAFLLNLNRSSYASFHGLDHLQQIQYCGDALSVEKSC